MLRVKVDTTEIETALRRVQGEKQIPFAIASALTKTVIDAQKFVRGKLAESFTIRSPWVAKGIRITPATKTTLAAAVGSVDPFMERQAVGGEKTAKSGAVAIPQVGRGRPRTTIKSATRPAKWPKAQLRRPTVFAGSVAGRPGVWQRVKVDGKPRLRLLYWLRPSVEVKPRWPLLAEVETVVRTRWPTNATNAIGRALRTAR